MLLRTARAANHSPPQPPLTKWRRHSRPPRAGVLLAPTCSQRPALLQPGAPTAPPSSAAQAGSSSATFSRTVQQKSPGSAGRAVLQKIYYICLYIFYMNGMLTYNLKKSIKKYFHSWLCTGRPSEKEYLRTSEVSLQSHRSIKNKKKKRRRRAHFTSDIANYILISAQGNEGRHLVHYHCTAVRHRRSTQLTTAPRAGLGRGIGKRDVGCAPAAGRPARWGERQSETLIEC